MPTLSELVQAAAQAGPGFGLGLAFGLSIFLGAVLRGVVVPRAFYRREVARADRLDARLERVSKAVPRRDGNP